MCQAAWVRVRVTFYLVEFEIALIIIDQYTCTSSHIFAEYLGRQTVRWSIRPSHNETAQLPTLITVNKHYCTVFLLNTPRRAVILVENLGVRRTSGTSADTVL